MCYYVNIIIICVTIIIIIIIIIPFISQRYNELYNLSMAKSNSQFRFHDYLKIVPK